jgi:hypothetical protein
MRCPSLRLAISCACRPDGRKDLITSLTNDGDPIRAFLQAHIRYVMFLFMPLAGMDDGQRIGRSIRFQNSGRCLGYYLRKQGNETV